MTVFHVAKNTNYSVMFNHHLRNRKLSLKAKGLLSQMLSLPEKWDYTLQGLTCINREQIDAIRQAVHELERGLKVDACYCAADEYGVLFSLLPAAPTEAIPLTPIWANCG